jgi:hypothetical protein
MKSHKNPHPPFALHLILSQISVELCIHPALILILAVLCQTGFSQGEASSFPEIRIYISKRQYSDLIQGKGAKMTLKAPVMLINHDTAAVKEIHSRGNNSLSFERKSLSVDLDDGVPVRSGAEKIKVRKFDLLNLVMDKNLWHNRWAFLAMAEIGIFPLFQTYCTVWINDQPQGIYLLVEKPHHYSETKAGSPYMLRRGVDHAVDNEYIDTSSKEEAKKYKKQFLTLYNDIYHYKGEALYQQLSNTLLIDHYFDWLAFNYLVMNGDYSDELYLYIVQGTSRFDIIPWDYDDTFKAAPHEGMQARNAVAGFQEKLVFSSEDPLDRAIATDAYVYEKYLAVFKQLLEKLTPETMARLYDQVRNELQVLGGASEISKASLYLGRTSFDIGFADADIRLTLDFIVKRRNALLKRLP